MKFFIKIFFTGIVFISLNLNAENKDYYEKIERNENIKTIYDYNVFFEGSKVGNLKRTIYQDDNKYLMKLDSKISKFFILYNFKEERHEKSYFNFLENKIILDKYIAERKGNFSKDYHLNYDFDHESKKIVGIFNEEKITKKIPQKNGSAIELLDNNSYFFQIENQIKLGKKDIRYLVIDRKYTKEYIFKYVTDENIIINEKKFNAKMYVMKNGKNNKLYIWSVPEKNYSIAKIKHVGKFNFELILKKI